MSSSFVMSFYSVINQSRYSNKDNTTIIPMKILFGEGKFAEIIRRITNVAII